jgi:hypothetical protein
MHTSTAAVVWLHGDSLSPTDPALAANPDAAAVFVFDEPFLREAGLSFKRLLFLYECACEALEGRDAEIRRGEVVAELRDFCAARGSGELHVTASVSPRFKRYVEELRPSLRVVLHEAPPLVHEPDEMPRRFSRFWRKVQDEALRPTGDGPPELRAPLPPDAP